MKHLHTTVNGKQYTAKIDDRVLSLFLNWANEVLPNPLDKLKDIGNLPASVQEIITRDALDCLKNRRNVESPEIAALLRTPEGARKIACLALQRCEVLTDDEADKIIDASIDEHGSDSALTPV